MLANFLLFMQLSLMRRRRLSFTLLFTGVVFMALTRLWAEEDPIEALRTSGGVATESVPAEDVPASIAETAVTEADQPLPAEGDPAEALVERAATGDRATAYVIPITDAISKPNQFILRRGIKEAIANQAEALILEIDTPGGRGDIMVEIMEKVSRYDGLTIAFVNDEAMSAGAFISFAADEIWYVPGSIIGSAAVVSGGGEDFPASMKAKIDSYILAKSRSLAGDHPYKADVMQGMMDADYVLEIEGEVVDLPGNEEGKLLALTDSEALTEYNGVKLFGEGRAEDVDDLLNQRFGAGQWERVDFEVSVSEEIGKYIDAVGPLLIGLGILGLFIELKTPGFGVFGITGIVLLVTVFIGNYVAGLTGYEVIAVFFLGILLIAVEIFVFPGTFFFLAGGVLMVVGSLLWSMADLWPEGGGGGGIVFDPQAFVEPMIRLSLSMVITAVGLALVWRFLPDSWIVKKVALQTASARTPDVIAHGGASGGHLPDVGTAGIVIRELRPTGEVEVNGERFDAACEFGSLEKDTPIIVTGYKNFHLLVDRTRS